MSSSTFVPICVSRFSPQQLRRSCAARSADDRAGLATIWGSPELYEFWSREVIRHGFPPLSTSLLR